MPTSINGNQTVSQKTPICDAREHSWNVWIGLTDVDRCRWRSRRKKAEPAAGLLLPLRVPSPPPALRTTARAPGALAAPRCLPWLATHGCSGSQVTSLGPMACSSHRAAPGLGSPARGWGRGPRGEGPSPGACRPGGAGARLDAGVAVPASRGHFCTGASGLGNLQRSSCRFPAWTLPGAPSAQQSDLRRCSGEFVKRKLSLGSRRRLEPSCQVLCLLAQPTVRGRSAARRYGTPSATAARSLWVGDAQRRRALGIRLPHPLRQPRQPALCRALLPRPGRRQSGPLLPEPRLPHLKLKGSRSSWWGSHPRGPRGGGGGAREAPRLGGGRGRHVAPARARACPRFTCLSPRTSQSGPAGGALLAYSVGEGKQSTCHNSNWRPADFGVPALGIVLGCLRM